MALYEGLVEYDPKTTAPIPALAERWEVNNDSSELTFHLRHNGRFSNGDGITAHDFVYTIQRGLTPKLGSRNAALAYYTKDAQSYNEREVFARDPGTEKFLLAQDFDGSHDQAPKPDLKAAIPQPERRVPLSSQPVESVAAEYPPNPEDKTPDADTLFHHFMHSPERLVLPGDEKKRAKAVDADPTLKVALAGKQLVPVEGKDIGVEAVDDYTLRISRGQPAPVFLSFMPHQIFRGGNRKVIEKFGG